jgi:membrane protease YdiL (CAAX protease family)
MRAPELLPQWSPVRATVAVVLGVAAGLGAQAVVLARTDGRALATASITGGELILLAVVLLAARTDPRQAFGAAALGLRRTAPGAAVARCLGVLVSFWCTAWVIRIVLGTDTADGRYAQHAFAPGIGVGLVLGVAVVGPIVEEVVFRGYLFPAIADRRGDAAGAAFTALVFAAAHVLAVQPRTLPVIAVFGFAVCLLRAASRSILPGVALHAFINALALAVLSRGQLLWALPVAPLVAVAALLPLSGPRDAG